MRADNSHHIIAAARQRRELTRAKAIQALRTLDNNGAVITFETVARAAGVSRSWLYAQPDIRAEIERLRCTGRRAPTTPIPSRQRSSDTSLLKRLEAANQRNRSLSDENDTLRRQLAEVLGQLRAQTHSQNAPIPSPRVITTR